MVEDVSWSSLVTVMCWCSEDFCAFVWSSFCRYNYGSINTQKCY